MHPERDQTHAQNKKHPWHQISEPIKRRGLGNRLGLFAEPKNDPRQRQKQQSEKYPSFT
jgi:hypothetical protein